MPEKSLIRTSGVVFGVYVFACVSLLGLLNFDQLSYVRTPIGSLNGDDLLLGAIVLGSTPAYLRWRQAHAYQAIGALELAWASYVLLLTLSAVTAPVQSITEFFVHVRFVSRFALYFPSVVILNSAFRRSIFLWFSVAIAAVGTVFNVVQSTLGQITLFNSPIYSVDVSSQVGDIYRVNLAITSYIIYVFLLSICASIVFRRFAFTAYSAFVSISFLVIYYRSLWIGLASGLILILFTFLTRRSLRTRTIATYLLVPIALASVGLVLTTFGINAFTDVLDRIDGGIYALSTATDTWGERLRVANLMLATFDWNNWLTGAGLFGSFWSDFGVLDVFLHLGVLGCLAVGFVMTSSLAVSFATTVTGFRTGDRTTQIIGCSASAFIVTIVTYSITAANFLNPYTMPGVAIATALASSALASSPRRMLPRPWSSSR